MKDLEGLKYPEQIAFLKEEHGFSQAYANALVCIAVARNHPSDSTQWTDFLRMKTMTKRRPLRKSSKLFKQSTQKVN